MAGLVPAIPINGAAHCRGIEIAGTNPAMTLKERAPFAS